MRVDKASDGLIWVICLETKYNISVGFYHNSVSSHGHFRKGFVADVETSCFLGSNDCLETVAVEMEWVFAFIIVIDDNLHNIAFLENEGVGVDAVNLCIGGRKTGRHDGVKRRNLWTDIRDVVEEGTVGYVRDVPNEGSLRLTSSHRPRGCPS